MGVRKINGSIITGRKSQPRCSRVELRGLMAEIVSSQELVLQRLSGVTKDLATLDLLADCLKAALHAKYAASEVRSQPRTV